MTPDKVPHRSASRGARSRRQLRALKVTPQPAEAYDIAYFKRHKDDDPSELVPGRDFITSCPAPVQAKLAAVLTAVAAAPPPRFSGGGLWEAMHDRMTGYHEIRVDGPGRRHYRLFCKLDIAAQGSGPLLTVLCGATKAFGTELSDAEYERVLSLGREYLARNPRSLA